MNRTTAICGLLLTAALALPAAAAALPELLKLPGEEFPIRAEGAVEGEGKPGSALSTALSAPLTANEVQLLLEWPISGSSGSYELHLLGIKFESKPCHSVSSSGSANLVWTRLAAEGGLQTAVLLTVPKFSLKCELKFELLTIQIEGGLLLGVEEIKEETGVTLFKLNVKCTKPENGKQELKNYFDDEGVKVKAILKANLGLGPETACEEVPQLIGIETNQPAKFVNL